MSTIRLVLKGQRYHDDLSGNGDGQLLFETLVNVLHAVEEDDTHQSHDERADVSAGDVFKHSDETLHREHHDHRRISREILLLITYTQSSTPPSYQINK